MPSYQDLETRLAQVERKLEFVMKSFTVTTRERLLGPTGQPVIRQRSLLALYQDITAAGVEILDPSSFLPEAPHES